MSFVFSPIEAITLPVLGSDARLPVARVFCVGRNYAAHAREMGADDREPPFFFMKPTTAVVQNGTAIPYPSRSQDVHHEVELVIALGHGGANIAVSDADQYIYGYAVGIDLTRRDLQSVAKSKGHPWEVGKAFDGAAPVSTIVPKQHAGDLGHAHIQLTVNGQARQSGTTAEMIWTIPEIIAELSTYFLLMPGDLIFTGTPAGVAAVSPGDVLEGTVDGLEPLRVSIK